MSIQVKKILEPLELRKSRPVLKWAGGKTQLLDQLMSRFPNSYGKYIEPFFGGGALFFNVRPKKSIIADINPELVNLYQQIATRPSEVIDALSSWENTEDSFYRIRSLDRTILSHTEAAARTIYLNRTCFNGLYRVNKKGHFNVPYGRYKNPTICNQTSILAASEALKNTEIVLGDYKAVLLSRAEKGDLVFLDPPYLPVSEYADFKRYTKEQFYEDDHRDLAAEVKRLHELGCHVILTNSNHPLVHELYGKFDISIHKTRRNISSNSNSRTGEDVIVVTKPIKPFLVNAVPKSIDDRASQYPPTRYMGSKEKLLPYIKDVVENFEFETSVDLFSGSGVVGYLFKTMGKQVVSNDYMAMSTVNARAMIENNDQILTQPEIDGLFDSTENNDDFVAMTFEGLYFSQSDNITIDTVRANIKKIRNPHKRAIAMSALIRACLKKRARGIFTYTGLRYDDGRADLKLSIEEHTRNAVSLINGAVFDNGKTNIARNGDAMSVRYRPDLVYLDPPYFSELSDNEYVRRYHFVEGLARNWEGVEMQWHTKTKKFKSYPTPFSSRLGAYEAFDKLFKKFRESIIVLSYSSNSLPTKDEIIQLMSKYKSRVEVVDVDYRYSFGNQGHKIRNNQNEVKEYIFVGY